MTRKKFKLRKCESDREKQILINAITNTEFLQQIQPFNYELFQTSYASKVIDWVQEYYEKYNRAPNKDIQNLFSENKTYLKETEESLIETFLQNLSNKYAEQEEPVNTQYALDQAREYFRERDLIVKLDMANLLAERGDFDKAEELIKDYKNTTSTATNDFKPYLYPANEFCQLLFPKINYLLDPWLSEASITLIYSEPGVGKSYFAMEIIGALATGHYAFDEYYPTSIVKSVYIDGELPASTIQKRLKELGLNDNPNLAILSKMALGWQGGPPLDLAQSQTRDKITAAVKEHGARLIILDNIFSLFGGDIDSNADKDWRPVNDWLLYLRSLHVATVLIHHGGKSGDQLGTSSRLFNINTALKLVPIPPLYGTEDPPTLSFRIEVKKSRDLFTRVKGRQFEFIPDAYCYDHFKRTPMPGWIITDLSSEAENKARRVIKMLAEGQEYKSIAFSLGFKSIGRISQIKKSAVEKGYLNNDNTLTELGKKYTDE